MPPRKRTKTTHGESHATASKAVKSGKGSTSTTVARGGGRSIRGRRGGLQDMPKMPLDVLFEIFGFLHPRDLLSLSRTSKDFRAFLMSRNAANFWENARKHVEGLPDKPSHLSEPAYANLLFCNHCHNCLKSGAHVMAYWDITARYCASCRTEMFTSKCDSAFKPIWLEFEVESHEIVVRVHMQSDRFRGAWYHKPELDKIEQEWKLLGNKTQKTRYIKDRKMFVNRAREFYYELERWQTGLRQRAAAEKASMKVSRYEQVLAKLRDEGWGEELDRMDKGWLKGLHNLDQVSRPSKLTDKSWANIRDSVVEYMQKFKSLRLSKERASLLDSRLRYLKHALNTYQHTKWPAGSQDRIYAGFADCAYMSDVRAIIEDTPASVAKATIKTELAEILPNLVNGWAEERRAEFVTLLRKELGEGSAAASSQEPLNLAIASFMCLGCRTTVMRWPAIAEHRCCYRSDDDSLYAQRVKSVGRTTADMRFPGIKCVGIHSRIDYTRDIVSLCGADPDTVTLAEMDACLVRLACRRCATYARQQIFDWKDAITHDLEQHKGWNSTSGPLPGRWMVLSEENAAKARALEAAHKAKPLNLQEVSYYRSHKYHCGWCSHAGSTTSDMYSHLEQSHERLRTEAVLDEDFYVTKRYKVDIWMYSDVFSGAKSEKEAVAAGLGFFASF